MFIIATSVTGPILGKTFLNRMSSLSDLITDATTSKYVKTDDDQIPGSASFEAIDGNLALMQTGLSAIKAIDTGGDQALEAEKSSALMMSSFGTAGPGVVAGVLLLLNKVAMALFVGFAPVFIMFFAFKQTEPMFWTWLKFGITTMFSLAVLTFMTGLATDMVARLAGMVFVSDLLGTDTSGITSATMQQGGLGLILSTLIVTVPPMVGNFFGAQIGTFMPQSAFGGWGSAASPAKRGDGGFDGGSGVPKGEEKPAGQGKNENTNANNQSMNYGGRVNQSPTTAQPDAIKSNSTMGNAQTSQALGAGPTATGSTQASASNNQSVASAGIGDDSAAVKQRLTAQMATPPQV